MKIILWIGNESNQRALANKIHSFIPLAGIVTETRKQQPKITMAVVLKKLFEKVMLPSIGKSWWGMKSHFDKIFPDYPETEKVNVENINSDEAFEFTKKINPDLILVSGTRLVKEKMLSFKPRIGILNLHTGLSPYVKGGPNCTNWCIATEQFHLIGNTVMWIDSGIDSGNILTTEFTEFNGTENLPEIHLKIMEHAHALCLKAIRFLSEGHNSNVSQASISKGKTYYTRDWTLTQKIRLVRNIGNFRNSIRSGKVKNDQTSIITIKL